MIGRLMLVEPTREQRNALEALSLQHGNAEVTMNRSTAGDLMFTHHDDNARFTINEDGNVTQWR